MTSRLGSLQLGIAILLLISFSLISTLGHADKKSLAKEKYTEAMELYDDEKYEKALDAFLASYQLLPRPGKLMHIANCYVALFQFTNAMKYYELYVEEMGDSMSESEKEKVETKMDRVKKQVGKMVVKSEDIEGDLYVDGVKKGTLPMDEPLYFSVGSYDVIVRHEGKVVYKKMVIIEGGSTVGIVVEEMKEEKSEEKLAAEEGEEEEKPKKAKKGTVLVEVDDEESAIVFVDGMSVGGAPFEDEFLPGEYKIEVKAPGRPKWKGNVTVEAGEKTSVAINYDATEKAPSLNPMFWAGLGASVPTLTAGVVMAVFSKQRNDEAARLTHDLDAGLYDADPVMKAEKVQRQHDIVEVGKRERTAGIVLLAIAGVFAAATVSSLFIFTKERPAADADIEVSTVTPIADPETGTIGLSLQATF